MRKVKEKGCVAYSKAPATHFPGAPEFLFCLITRGSVSTGSRPVLGPTQPPIQWVPAALSPGAKQPGREADQSPPTSVEGHEYVDLYIHSPIRPHGVVLN
jgi:hypothetical protein